MSDRDTHEFGPLAWWLETWLLVRLTEHTDRKIAHLERTIMASIEDVQADVQALTAAQQAASAALDDLAAKVANIQPGPVSQAQLDELDAQIKSVGDALNASVAKDDPAPSE